MVSTSTSLALGPRTVSTATPACAKQQRQQHVFHVPQTVKQGAALHGHEGLPDRKVASTESSPFAAPTPRVAKPQQVAGGSAMRRTFSVFDTPMQPHRQQDLHPVTCATPCKHEPAAPPLSASSTPFAARQQLPCAPPRCVSSSSSTGHAQDGPGSRCSDDMDVTGCDEDLPLWHTNPLTGTQRASWNPRTVTSSTDEGDENDVSEVPAGLDISPIGHADSPFSMRGGAAHQAAAASAHRGGDGDSPMRPWGSAPDVLRLQPADGRLRSSADTAPGGGGGGGGAACPWQPALAEISPMPAKQGVRLFFSPGVPSAQRGAPATLMPMSLSTGGFGSCAAPQRSPLPPPRFAPPPTPAAAAAAAEGAVVSDESTLLDVSQATEADSFMSQDDKGVDHGGAGAAQAVQELRLGSPCGSSGGAAAMSPLLPPAAAPMHGGAFVPAASAAHAHWLSSALLPPPPPVWEAPSPQCERSSSGGSGAGGVLGSLTPFLRRHGRAGPLAADSGSNISPPPPPSFGAASVGDGAAQATPCVLRGGGGGRAATPDGGGLLLPPPPMASFFQAARAKTPHKGGGGSSGSAAMPSNYKPLRAAAAAPCAPHAPHARRGGGRGGARLDRNDSLQQSKVLATASEGMVNGGGGSSSGAVDGGGGGAPQPVSFAAEFVNLGVVGAGAFAVVLRARWRRDGCVYAVKRGRAALRGRRDRDAGLGEARALRAVAGCAHVVRFVRAWQEDRILHVQMELCELGSLQDVLDGLRAACGGSGSTGGGSGGGGSGTGTFLNGGSGGGGSGSVSFLGSSGGSGVFPEGGGGSGGGAWPLPDASVWKVARDVGVALRAIHAAAIVHGDIKPANVLLSASGRLKVGDFGVAGGAGDGEAEGDWCYRAPELNGAASPPADMFSLGITLYELATGARLPDGGAAWHALREGAPPPLPRGSGSAALAAAVAALMAPDAAARPTAAQLLIHADVAAAGDVPDAFLMAEARRRGLPADAPPPPSRSASYDAAYDSPSFRAATSAL